MIRKALQYKTLDSICVFLIFCSFIYELPVTAISALAASFGIYENEAFYSYRVKFAAIVIGVASLNLIINHRYVFKNVFFLLYIFFLTYMTVIVWINREMYGFETIRDENIISALEFHLPIFFKYSLFFLIGFYLPRIYKYRIFLIFFLIALLCMIVFHVDFEKMGIDTQNYVDRSFTGNYLFIGDATSVAALISIAFFRSINTKIIFTLVCAVVIFYVGSRTSFAAFTATVFLYFIVSFKPKLLIASATCVIAAGVALSSLDMSELQERNPRMFGVVVDLESDRSMIGRREFAEYGWEEISDSIIMGNFGGQLTSGPPGEKTAWRSYMHSVFSYWRQFGLLAFITVIAFAVHLYTKLWKYRDKRRQTIFALYLLVSVFIFIETVFSRSFTFQYTHIFFGLTVAINYTIASGNKYAALAAHNYQSGVQKKPRKMNSRTKRKKRRSRRI